jgi:hypothetical protein
MIEEEYYDSGIPHQENIKGKAPMGMGKINY